MPRYVLDKKEFIKGLALSDELGGLWYDQQAIDVYRQPGVLRAGFGRSNVYTESSSPALTTLITQLVRANGASAIYALSNAHAVRIILNAANGENPIGYAFAGAGIADKKGAVMYKIASGQEALFYSLDTDIGMLDTSLTFNSDASWVHNFMSTVPTGAATISTATFRAMYHFQKSDKIYWNGSANQVDQFDANVGAGGTLAKNALDIPTTWEIRDFAYLNNYLAILGTTPLTDSNVNNIQKLSKIFYWDTFSDSWSYETPIIKDRLYGLVNDGSGLFAFGEGTNGLSAYQLGLEDVVSLFDWPGSGNAVNLTAGRLDGNNNANYHAIKNIGKQFLMLGKDGNNAHLFSFGSKVIGLPVVLNKAHYLATASSTIRLGDLLPITPGKYYASYLDGTVSRIIRLSSANSADTSALADTIELDSFFGGDGREKTAKYIEVHFEPMGATDQVTVKYDKNLSGSFTDIAATAALSRFGGGSDNPGTNGTHWVFDRLSIGNFRQLKLRFTFAAGAAKIRKIIVGFDYAPDRK